MPKTNRKSWFGSVPTHCDICKEPITFTFIDGKTNRTLGGCWANMCPSCHEVYGVGLGTGLGQQYLYSRTEDKFLKVKG